MGMVTGRIGTSGWCPTIFVVAPLRKEDKQIVWMIQTMMAMLMIWTMASNGDDNDTITEEGF